MCTASNFIAPHVVSSAIYTLMAVQPYYGQVTFRNRVFLYSLLIGYYSVKAITRVSIAMFVRLLGR